MEQRWGLPLIAWPSRLRPNLWDLAALPLVLGALALVAWGGMAMGAHYQLGEPLSISLDPWRLPEYALRTVLRMAAALVVSLAFSFPYAALAAKSRQAEKILIPVLDILQSVPVLGFLSITVTGFIALFPGRLLGVECAAIFAIFTSQAWNMTFSLYQSLRTVPVELTEAARMYHLSAWQRFWRLEVPHGVPPLIWNMMMSVSAGWFFVVASEAITVSGQSILLPGIGSYIATAIDQRDLGALAVASAAVVWLVAFVRQDVSADEIGWVVLLGALTALRVVILIALASLIWVPIGVSIGLRPQIAERVQPIVQFLSAFPANLLFPAAVVLILRFDLNPEIWLSPLMILGTQWYILFNVIAGTAALPAELKLVASNLGVRRWLWWRRIMLPAIFPAYVTGAVTAAGGSWNASIVAEVVQWGDTTLHATGIGAYIAEYTAAGDPARIALGIGVLCLYVIAFNRLLWHRLYELSIERLRLD